LCSWAAHRIVVSDDMDRVATEFPFTIDVWHRH
jgi:hypothetical protein